MKVIKSICLLIFGLSQKDARSIQRIWFFWLPPLSAFLIAENPGLRPAGWMLFAVMLALSFWNGFHGWGWGKKWLWGIALYSIIVVGMLFLVGNLEIAGFLSPLLLLLAFPLLWPSTLTKASHQLFHGGTSISIALSFWGLWLVLLAAYSAGAFLKGKSRSI